MKKIIHVVLLAILSMQLPNAASAVKVFACEPEWKALAEEIGGDKVRTYSATTAFQDPHHIQARPSLIAKVRNADFLVCTGAELEIGWLPVLLRQAANPKVQQGQAGHFIASQHVTMLGVPAVLDRSMGDVHPYGNPHIQTDPRRILQVAPALAQTLITLDPQHADHYRKRLHDFESRWQKAITGWEERARPLRDIQVVVQHQNWDYLEQWLGFRIVASLEDKPGIPPSVSHLNEVIKQVKQQPVKMVIRAAYQDEKPSQWFSQQMGVAEAVLPFTVGGSDKARNLFSLFDDTLDQLLKNK